MPSYDLNTLTERLKSLKPVAEGFFADRALTPEPFVLLLDPRDRPTQGSRARDNSIFLILSCDHLNALANDELHDVVTELLEEVVVNGKPKAVI